MRFMLSQSLAQVPVKYVSVQCKGSLLMVLYGNLMFGMADKAVLFALAQHRVD